MMAEETIRMLNLSIDAFVREDTALAEKVIGMDDKVDGLFCTIKQELIELIRQDAQNGGQAGPQQAFFDTARARAFGYFLAVPFVESNNIPPAEPGRQRNGFF